jgi:ATP-dependent Clp protease ATP-binding subunit ClpC
MEEGHLTDSFGRKVDFKNTILIMTTNVGAKAISSPSFGFTGGDLDAAHDEMKKNVLAEVSKRFKPEFIGRLDEIVVFKKLTQDDMKHIVEIELSKVRERLKERGITVELTDAAKEYVIANLKKDGDRDHNDYGARPLRRSVEMCIEDPLAEELLRGAFEGKNHIRVDVKQVGDEKRLDFEGLIVDQEPSSTPELAVVGTSDSGDAPSE